MSGKLVGLSAWTCLAMIASASAQPFADAAACQEHADRLARAIGVKSSPIADDRFDVSKTKVASVSGGCDGSLSVEPDPEPFDEPLSPAYPALAARAVAAAYSLKPAEATRVISACVKAAVADPPTRSSRAGFARQRWRNSQMTGSTVASGLKVECTYHNGNKRAAALTIAKVP